MPLTVIPPQYLTDARSPSIGQSFGEALGDTLRYLATNKLQQIEQRQQNQELEDAGYSPGQIKLLNQFKGSPAEQYKIMSTFNAYNALKGGQFPGIASLQELPGIQAIQSQNPMYSPMSPMNMMNQQQMQPQQIGRSTQRQNTLADVLGNLAEQDAIMRTLGKLPISGPQQGIQNIGQALGALTGQQPTDYRQFQQPMAQQPNQAFQPIQPGAQPLQQPNYEELTPAQQLAAFPYISPAEQRKEQLELKKMEQRERHFMTKEERAEQRDIDRDTKEYYEKAISAEKSAITSGRRLNEMDALINEGNLGNAKMINFLNNIEDVSVGLPYIGKLHVGGFARAIKGLMINAHPDRAEFESLSNNFIENAKAIFGNRITDVDLRAFLKTVPTLMQTDDGKRRVIALMRLANDSAMIQFKGMKDVIENNGGKRPRNLELLTEDYIAPQVDSLGNRFNQQMSEMRRSYAAEQEKETKAYKEKYSTYFPEKIEEERKKRREKYSRFL